MRDRRGDWRSTARERPQETPRAPGVALIGAATPDTVRMAAAVASGVAESLDWVEALLALGARSLAPADLDKAAASLGAFVKYREDQERVAQRLAEWAAAG